MITTLNGNWIAVEVPEIIGKVRKFEVNYNLLQCFGVKKEWLTDIPLPPGSYTFCLLYPSGVTEENAREIVDWYGKGDGSIDECGVGDVFWCYDDSELCCDTALESLRTLMLSKGCDNNKNYAICQNQ
jgi:hypothetical protein